MVYIVMIGTASTYSYDGVVWNVDRVFSSMESAKKYIEEQKKVFNFGVEYDIDAQELYA